MPCHVSPKTSPVSSRVGARRKPRVSRFSGALRPDSARARYLTVIASEQVDNYLCVSGTDRSIPGLALPCHSLWHGCGTPAWRATRWAGGTWQSERGRRSRFPKRSGGPLVRLVTTQMRSSVCRDRSSGARRGESGGFASEGRRRGSTTGNKVQVRGGVATVVCSCHVAANPEWPFREPRARMSQSAGTRALSARSMARCGRKLASPTQRASLMYATEGCPGSPNRI
jgi:hypothetical protein